MTELRAIEIGGDVAVTRPSWVSYAAQASLAGRAAHFVPGSAGVPNADQLARAVTAARAAENPVRSVVVTLPDNPTGRLATAAAVRDLCSVAEAHDPDAPFTSPAEICPERTAVTAGLSKNLALGGESAPTGCIRSAPCPSDLFGRTCSGTR